MTTNPTRRQFLRRTASASVAAVMLADANSVPSATPDRKMTIDLRCDGINVAAGQQEAIDLAHKYGFESVAPVPDDLARMSDARLVELKESLKAKKLVLSAASPATEFRKDQAAFDEGMKALPAFAAALQRAGVTRAGTWVYPAHSELTYRRNFQQHVSRLGPIARVLADHGVRLGLEYIGPRTFWTGQKYIFIHTLAEMRELIAEIPGDNVGLILDCWHWYHARDTVEDLLTLTNRDVVAVDINDAPAGIPRDQQVDSARELPAATGVIDLAGFLNALVKIGYDGPVRAEPFNKALFELPANDARVAATAAAMKKAFALIQ